MLRRSKQAPNRDPARLSMLVWARQHDRISGPAEASKPGPLVLLANRIGGTRKGLE